MSPMTILALEFSSPRRSAALVRDGQLLGEAVEPMSGRGTNAFGLITKLLAETGVQREEIETMAVGMGPGSYTGIRAAIAVVQGWQLACGTKLMGISSVESLAAQAQVEKVFGRVNLVIDAQRGEFYLSTWEITAAARREIAPLKIVPAAEVTGLKAANEICAGPEMERLLYPSAAMVAALAVGRSEFLAGDRLEPIYLRETSFVKAPAGRVI